MDKPADRWWTAHWKPNTHMHSLEGGLTTHTTLLQSTLPTELSVNSFEMLHTCLQITLAMGLSRFVCWLPFVGCATVQRDFGERLSITCPWHVWSRHIYLGVLLYSNLGSDHEDEMYDDGCYLGLFREVRHLFGRRIALLLCKNLGNTSQWLLW